jgi:anti-anti-sigma regulatory factor
MLAGLFSQWSTQPVRLRFDGADHLERVLRNYTVSGNKGTNNSWWRLRMDALRVMGRQDDFELAALDYCVTYEVSPPAWTDPHCEYANAGSEDALTDKAEGAQALAAEGESQDHPSHTVPMSLDGVTGTVVALSGEIRGDAAEFLQQLEASRSQGQGRLVVSCSQLIRVDFSAAGSILNWVASRQEEGLQVQFRDVHRLVGAFFNVIGINEHAKVVLRAN